MIFAETENAPIDLTPFFAAFSAEMGIEEDYAAEVLFVGERRIRTVNRETRGVEAKNFEFLLHCGVAEGSWSWRDVIQSTVLLLTDEASRKRLADAVHAFLPLNAAEQVCRIVVRQKA